MKKFFSVILVILLVTGSGLMSRPVFASGETITNIAVNQVYQGTVNSYDYVTYSFTLPSNGNVTLSMLRDAQSSWGIELKDANGNQLVDYNISTDSVSIGYDERQIGLAKGTYYVSISNKNYNSESNSYKFQVKYTAGDGFEKEGNNSADTANPIHLNTVNKGAIQGSGDEDYYIFSTPADGNVTLSIKRNANCRWGVTLYSADGAASYQSFDTTNGSKVTGLEERQIGLPKGTYIVKVEDSSYSSYNVGYELQVKFTAGSRFEKEYNDDSAHANPILLNNTYLGVLQRTGDEDFYSFTLPSDGNVTLSMKRTPGSRWGMTLYSSMNSSDNGLESFDTFSETNAIGYEERQIGLPKGTYFIKIDDANYSTADVPYQFQVKYDAGNYFEKENNDSLATANPISLNAVNKGVLQGDNDKDSYRFSLTKKQQVRISIPRKSGASWNAELYDTNGESLGSFSTKSDSSVTGNEEKIFTLNPGHYYIVISNYGYSNTTDVPYELALWTAAPQITPDQVKVTNNTSKNDTVAVSGLARGDIVKVYNASKGGTLLASSTAGASGNVSMSVKQVGQKAGNVYITVSKKGWAESVRTLVKFNGEQSSSLSARQVTTENNKGKPDLMTINSLGAGDIVHVYNPSGKLIGVSMPAENGQAAIAFVQLGKTAGKVYVTVTRAGMAESGKITISFKAE